MQGRARASASETPSCRRVPSGAAARSRLAVHAVVLLLLLPALATGQTRRTLVVGLDARNGPDAASRLGSGAAFEDLRARLLQHGLRIRPLQDFTPRALVGIDLLILQQPYTEDQAFGPAERMAIRSSIHAGAGLLVCGDVGGQSDAWRPALNGLLERFGLALGPTPDGGPTLDGEPKPDGGARSVLTGFVDHALTRGVDALAVDAPRPLDALRAPAVDLTLGSGPDELLAASERPDWGRVVLVGDASLWRDSDDASGDGTAGLGAADNALLLDNALSYLLHRDAAAPAPVRPFDVEAGLRVRLDQMRDRRLGLPAGAETVLRLLVPEAATSGRFVQLSVTGAEPGALVLVLLGDPRGGVLRAPQLLASVAADTGGTATFDAIVPASAAGQVFGLRLVDLGSGQTSPIIRFEPERR